MSSIISIKCKPITIKIKKKPTKDTKEIRPIATKRKKKKKKKTPTKI